MQAPADTAIAAQPATPPNFDVPADACDCHTHIFGDPQSFPFFAGRVYTPPTALPDEMAALHRALRIRRVVMVTPSVYGTDNSATLYGLRARGADARGVAVIDEKTSQRDLDARGSMAARRWRASAGSFLPSVERLRRMPHTPAAARASRSRCEVFSSITATPRASAPRARRP